MDSSEERAIRVARNTLIIENKGQFIKVDLRFGARFRLTFGLVVLQ